MYAKYINAYNLNKLNSSLTYIKCVGISFQVQDGQNPWIKSSKEKNFAGIPNSWKLFMHQIGAIKYVLCPLWQYGLWSIQTGDTKLERFLLTYPEEII